MNRQRFLTAAFAIAVLFSISALGQLTEFTYQGKLRDGGNIANGPYDFQFGLYSAPTGGFPQGPNPLSRNNVSVVDGVFTVSLDFGNQFPGADRYLEIRVRSAGGGTFTTLSPRQKIVAIPNSVSSFNSEIANVAQTANTLEGQPASFYSNASNLSSGTVPDERLSSFISRTSSNQTFSGVNNFTNTGNTFTGGGAGLTGLNASNLASGTVADARLSTNVPRLNAANTFSGANTFSNTGNSFSGAGSGLTSLSASNISSGTLGDARLSTNIPRLGSSNVFTGDISLSGSLVVDRIGLNSGGVQTNAIRFGPNSGEGIYSSRLANPNLLGIDITTDSQPRLSITQSGNVGIGTQSPSAKLDVNGTIVATNLPAIAASQTYRDARNLLNGLTIQNSFATLETLNVNVPSTGFLLITATANVGLFWVPGSSLGTLTGHFKIEDLSSGNPVQLTEVSSRLLPDGTAPTRNATVITVSWVVSVNAGPKTYRSVLTVEGAMSAFTTTLTAQYFPRSM